MKRELTDAKRSFWMAALATVLFMLSSAATAYAGYSLHLVSAYGDHYYLNLVTQRTNYQIYKGTCTYAGFSLSGMSLSGDVRLIRIKATATMPEYFNMISTSMRWSGKPEATLYVLSETFRVLGSSTTLMVGYENWYPFDLSCNITFNIVSGGFTPW